MFEIQKYTGRGYQHIGYANKLFKTLIEACIYYDNRFYPRLRQINDLKNYRSDWDPKNGNIRFVIRSWWGEFLNFDLETLTSFTPERHVPVIIPPLE
jgi:hypothetical protein